MLAGEEIDVPDLEELSVQTGKADLLCGRLTNAGARFTHRSRGSVTISDSEILVRAATGDEGVAGLGPAWCREQVGFTITVGDEVSVVGFHADGEFKAVTVETVTPDDNFTPRDATGCPALAEPGNRRNSQP